MTDTATQGAPEHEPFDFVAFAAQLTNEQKILAELEKITSLMTKLVDASSWTPRTGKHLEAAAEPEKPSRAEQLDKLVPNAKRGFGRK